MSRILPRMTRPHIRDMPALVVVVLLLSIMLMAPGRSASQSSDQPSMQPQNQSAAQPQVNAPTSAAPDPAVQQEIQADDLTTEGVEIQIATIESIGEQMALDQKTIEDQAQLLSELEKALKEVNNGVERNSETIGAEVQRLDDKFKRLDPISQRLDSVSAEVEGFAEEIDDQRTLIEDNFRKLNDRLTRIVDTAHELSRLRPHLERLAEGNTPLPQPTTATGHDDETRLLITLFLGLMVPLGIGLYQTGQRVPQKAGGPVDQRAGIRLDVGTRSLLAWLAAGIGFTLVGIGIMFGTSQAGLFGSPFQFLPDLMRVGSEPDLLLWFRLLASQWVLAGAVALILSAAAADRVSPLGHLWIAFAVGALVYPMIGHWIDGGHLAEENQGWLQATGFLDPGGATAVVALGGLMAIGLLLGLGREHRKPTAGPSRDASIPVVVSPWSALGVLLLWLGWLGVVRSDPGMDADANMAGLVLTSYLTAAGSGLAVVLVGSLFQERLGWSSRLPGGVLVGVLTASGLTIGTGVAENLLAGLVVGALYSLAMEPLRHWLGEEAELPGIFVLAGLWGTLATALFGPDGYLHIPVTEQISSQFLGMTAVALVAMAAGHLLALAIQRLGLVRARGNTA